MSYESEPRNHRAENKKLRKACEKARLELNGFLGCCGEDEIRDSFQGFLKAVKMCESALAGLPAPAETVNEKLRAACELIKDTDKPGMSCDDRYDAIFAAQQAAQAALALADKVTP